MSNKDKTAAKVIDEFCARVMVIPEAERADYIEITVCMGVAMMRGGAGDEYVRGFLKGALADLDKPSDTLPMTREEIDVLWEQAFTLAASTSDLHRRYEFANLILEAASEACKTEWNGDSDSYEWSLARNECADDIRSMKV